MRDKMAEKQSLDPKRHLNAVHLVFKSQLIIFAVLFLQKERQKEPTLKVKRFISSHHSFGGELDSRIQKLETITCDEAEEMEKDLSRLLEALLGTIAIYFNPDLGKADLWKRVIYTLMDGNKREES